MLSGNLDPRMMNAIGSLTTQAIPGYDLKEAVQTYRRGEVPSAMTHVGAAFDVADFATGPMVPLTAGRKAIRKAWIAYARNAKIRDLAGFMRLLDSGGDITKAIVNASKKGPKAVRSAVGMIDPKIVTHQPVGKGTLAKAKKATTQPAPPKKMVDQELGLWDEANAYKYTNTKPHIEGTVGPQFPDAQYPKYKQLGLFQPTKDPRYVQPELFPIEYGQPPRNTVMGTAPPTRPPGQLGLPLDGVEYSRGLGMDSSNTNLDSDYIERLRDIGYGTKDELPGAGAHIFNVRDLNPAMDPRYPDGEDVILHFNRGNETTLHRLPGSPQNQGGPNRLTAAPGAGVVSKKNDEFIVRNTPAGSGRKLEKNVGLHAGISPESILERRIPPRTEIKDAGGEALWYARDPERTPRKTNMWGETVDSYSSRGKQRTFGEQIDVSQSARDNLGRVERQRLEDLRILDNEERALAIQEKADELAELRAKDPEFFDFKDDPQLMEETARLRRGDTYKVDTARRQTTNKVKVKSRSGAYKLDQTRDRVPRKSIDPDVRADLGPATAGSTRRNLRTSSSKVTKHTTDKRPGRSPGKPRAVISVHKNPKTEPRLKTATMPKPKTKSTPHYLSGSILRKKKQ